MSTLRFTRLRTQAFVIGLCALSCLTTLEAQTAPAKAEVNPDNKVRFLQAKSTLAELLDAYNHVAFTQDVCTCYMLILEKGGKATLGVSGMSGKTVYVGKFTIEPNAEIALTLERKNGHPEGRWPEGKWSKMTFKRQGDNCSLELPKKDPQNPPFDSLDLIKVDAPILYSEKFLQDEERPSKVSSPSNPKD